MHDPSTTASNVLTFECPRCGHEERDDYEVLDSGKASAFRCGHCSRPFSVLLIECERCAAENVAVALAQAEVPAPTDVICAECGQPCVRDEDDQEAGFDH